MKSRAFTLIELLVVVLIIGILSAIALPQYQKAVAKARMAEGVSLVRALANAEKIYYLANGKYTTDMNNLDIDFNSNTNSADGSYTRLHAWLAESHNLVYAQPSQSWRDIYAYYIYYNLASDTMWCGAYETDAKSLNFCKGVGRGEMVACADLETIKCYELAF